MQATTTTLARTGVHNAVTAALARRRAAAAIVHEPQARFREKAAAPARWQTALLRCRSLSGALATPGFVSSLAIGAGSGDALPSAPSQVVQEIFTGKAAYFMLLISIRRLGRVRGRHQSSLTQRDHVVGMKPSTLKHALRGTAGYAVDEFQQAHGIGARGPMGAILRALTRSSDQPSDGLRSPLGVLLGVGYGDSLWR